ncbi:MAG: metalloregulator ArsR/SmtB family transcription factor [Deltaproteobacteria bacterium]|jgi:ArsR family transcriptional regulator|nr:metalloregulator ArsR/SmtB family transcription factor [Deltaproteobacteria bacterium]
MSGDELRLIKFFKAISDENKFKIISSLKEGEKCVCVIFKELSLNQTLVSHHLSALKAAGLIKGRKSGKWVYYSVNKKYFAEIESLFNKLLGHENFKNENDTINTMINNLC